MRRSSSTRGGRPLRTRIPARPHIETAHGALDVPPTNAVHSHARRAECVSAAQLSAEHRGDPPHAWRRVALFSRRASPLPRSAAAFARGAAPLGAFVELRAHVHRELVGAATTALRAPVLRGLVRAVHRSRGFRGRRGLRRSRGSRLRGSCRRRALGTGGGHQGTGNQRSRHVTGVTRGRSQLKLTSVNVGGTRRELRTARMQRGCPRRPPHSHR
jgi:hypothetical protein